MNTENMSDIDCRIRSILDDLKVAKGDRDEVWGKSVSSSIGVLCNHLSNIRSSEDGTIDSESLKTAIRIISVIQRSKETGVAEAKKRTINLSFLKNCRPQLSNTYLEDELTIYSFSALSNLKEKWCSEYICDEIGSLKVRENIKPLIQWLEKLNINLNDQILLLSKVKPSVYSEEEWIIFLIEFVTKNVKKDLSKFDRPLVELLTYLIAGSAVDEIKLSVLDQMHQLSQINPFLLIRAEILSYLTIAREPITKKSYGLITQICDRYLTTVTELLKFDLKKEDVDNLHSLWMIFGSLLNKKDAIKRTNMLNGFIATMEASNLDNFSKGIEYLAADLLSAWEDLPESTRLDPNSQGLCNKLEMLKVNLNISQYCSKGQMIIYDPIFQEPLSKDFVITDKVSIFKPGYFQTRHNGTTKVIKKALVSN